jgi:hypothetical protein
MAEVALAWVDRIDHRILWILGSIADVGWTSALVAIIERVWNRLQGTDLAAVILMTLPAICSNFLFLFAGLAGASAAVCAPLNHRSGDFGDFLNQ